MRIPRGIGSKSLIAFVLVLVVANPACKKPPQPVTFVAPVSNTEITRNPKAMFDPAVPRKDLTLYGIHFGDGAEKIAPDWQRQLDGFGSLVFDTHRFMISQGKVVGFSINETSVLNGLGIVTEADIPRVLGPPDQVIDRNFIKYYDYTTLHARLTWHDDDRLLGTKPGKPKRGARVMVIMVFEDANRLKAQPGHENDPPAK